jgi:hypothetical protein
MNREHTRNHERIAFVISPIGAPDSPERKRSDQILKHVIGPIASECGYKTIRADKISRPGIITTQVINHILNASLVIADLTGHNPNVFYELAVRHAAERPVIQTIRKGEEIPFDVSAQRTIEIDLQDLDNVAEAKRELERQIKAVEKDATLIDSPISTTVSLQLLKRGADPQGEIIAEMKAMLQESSSMMKEIYRKAQSSERKKAKGPIPRITTYVPLAETRGDFGIFVRIDKTLPWLQLKVTYETIEEARRAAEKFIRDMQVRIVRAEQKGDSYHVL